MSLVKLFGMKEVVKNEELDEPISKKKSTDLFTMMNNFFKDNIWDTYTKTDKSRNAFLLNRFMSINYPIQAAYFSLMGLPQWYLTDFWRNVMKKQFNVLPRWIYTKTKNVDKTTDDTPTLSFSFDDEVMDYFYKVNKCCHKEFEQAKQKFPVQLHKELKEIVRKIKSYK